MINVPISFIIPSRNNLRYLKHAYNSIRQNLEKHHEICMADDASTDDTWAWMQEISKKDKNVKIYKNPNSTRLGHCVLYDHLINNFATNDIFCIFHADMIVAKGMDTAMLKYMKPKTVVSATRIEPPLHPNGPEKIIKDFGIEPSEFIQSDFDEFVKKLKIKYKDVTTNGVFAPWIAWKSEFQEIGGHDQGNFSPQSKEDSDAFNRMKLNNIQFIQTWEGYVYHLTCRGSRFADGAKRNPDGKVFMKGRETNEWLAQNAKSTRNFIRKWQSTVLHDEYLSPIISNVYDVTFKVTNCLVGHLFTLEPWCARLYTDMKQSLINEYLKQEQPNTLYDLQKRIFNKHHTDLPDTDIMIEFDCSKLNNQNIQMLTQLSNIISDSGDVGTFELECFKIYINKMQTYQHQLIHADKSGNLR